jgi:phosphoribosylpyrophosphate synthetase
MLEVMGVDHVVTVDLHSTQVEGFFKPTIPVRGSSLHCVAGQGGW